MDSALSSECAGLAYSLHATTLYNASAQKRACGVYGTREGAMHIFFLFGGGGMYFFS